MTARLDLEALRLLLTAASPGEWVNHWNDIADADDGDDEVLITTTAPNRPLAGIVVASLWHDGPHVACTEADAALIVALRNQAEALIDELEAHRALAESARETLSDLTLNPDRSVSMNRTRDRLANALAALETP